MMYKDSIGVKLTAHHDPEIWLMRIQVTKLDLYFILQKQHRYIHPLNI